jgi:predicted RND superfamily exporter protein/CRP-like cAMP-binding protein
MKKLWRIPVQYPRATVLVLLAITAFFASFAARITVDSSIENLLPADDPGRRYYQALRDLFGSEEITVVGVFARDVFEPSTLAKIDILSRKLGGVEGVREVISLTTMKGAEMTDAGLRIGRLMRELPATKEEAERFASAVFANEIYLKNVVSQDRRAAGVTVVFDPITDEHHARRLEDAVRGAVEEMGGPEEYAVTGIPTLKVTGARLMEADTVRFTPLSLLLVTVVLAWTFRTVRGVFVPLATLLIGSIWTNGLMVLSGSAINMGTLVLNPLLMVIGVASGIHVVNQYYLELRPTRPHRTVVEHAMRHVRVPVAIAALTTTIGFGTLVFTPIQSIREFGLFSVFGIASILFASFTFIPAVLRLLPPPRRIGPRHAEGDWMVRALQSISMFAIRQRWPILVAGALVLAWSVWGITRINVQTDYLAFFDPTTPIRVDNARIAEALAGTQAIYVALDGDAPRAVVRLEAIRALHDLQRFVDEQPGVDKTLSMLDFMLAVREVVQPDAETPLPASQSEIDQVLLFVDRKDVAAVVDRKLTRTVIIARTTLSGSAEVGEFVRRVTEFARERLPGGIQVRVTGTVVLLNQSADELVWGQVTSLWQELLALLLLLSFLFVSLRVGALALIPNVVPTIILFGIMGWFGFSLNVSTSMIAAIAIGIAIDDTVHLLSSFNSELRRSGSQQRAVVYAIRTAGQAAVFITVALAAGFFIVCLSNFQPVRHFGLLSGITMGVALVTELLFTPALLATTKIVTLWDLLFLRLGPEPHKQIELFAGLRPFQAKIVVLMAHLASAPRGTFLTRRGEMKAELYVLLNGRADVRRGEDGGVIRSLGRGDVIGEMGLVRQRPRSADVVLAEETEYLVLDERFLRRLRRQYPRIAATVFLNLTRILSDRLEMTTDQLVSAAALRQEGAKRPA